MKTSSSILTFMMALAVVLSLSSCLTYKDIVNFQDGVDLGDGRLDTITNFAKWTIQPEDILQINVYSSNQEAAEQFNIMDTRIMAQVMQMGGGGGGLMEPIGYRVDDEGNIDIPVIGKIMASGKTVDAIKREVERRVVETGYLNDVNVQVRYLSFRLTVLGEVNAPGSYIIQSQKMNILEAIGLARDLNIFANRDNILVVREKNGIREYGRVNLKSKNIFESPFFYLQPNDVVYIEP
ncbi:MAG TPA: polysaccharide biosynthesis/export family protein, partial [Chitinophagaceae bacterium]|nr:polysaccharide biosynthesis/export family protein [Chitinophagaceae bacterium]